MTPKKGYERSKFTAFNNKAAGNNKVYFHDQLVNELLIKGNSKIGHAVWHWSMTPGCHSCGGTCFGTCEGCYGLKGRYLFDSVRAALAIRTYIARTDLDWFVREIIREIKNHKIKFCRIHVTGDFFSADYINAWHEIVKECRDTRFWTYTKSYGHGMDHELDALNAEPNCNIVRSVVKGCGYNFGHVEYVLDTYYKLISAGEDPYICKCGVDDGVSCSDCHKCAEHKYVLFLEHSTGYEAAKDPAYSAAAAVIMSQK